MSRYYNDRVYDRLVPWSVSKRLDEAVKEWDFVPTTYRDRHSSDVCQLCGHTGYLYSCRIRHRASGKVLWIGTTCLDNFWGPPKPTPKLLVRKSASTLVRVPPTSRSV